MAIYRCQRCSQLPPPPPIFSLEPPPNLLSVHLHCTARIEHKQIISSASSSTSFHFAILFSLCIIISIAIGAIVRNRLIKRKSNRQDLLSVNFNHHHRNWIVNSTFFFSFSQKNLFIILFQKATPLLSESSFETCDDIHHDYEQISYCLIYCRQCGNYHQTSCTCHWLKKLFLFFYF